MTIKPSQEQIDIVKAVVRGESVFVEAFAGSSKSFTTSLAVKHIPNKKVLYLTFNKHLQVEGEEVKKKYRFKNFFPLTVHKLAKTYTIDTGAVYIAGKRILWKPNGGWKCFKPFIHVNDMRGYVKNHSNMWGLAKEFNAFCRETDSTFKDVDSRILDIFVGAIKHGVITHDMYLKLFLIGLKEKTIDLSKVYDVFVLDEYQDASRQIGYIANNHGIQQMMMLGDTNQGVYQFLLKGYDISKDGIIKTLKRYPLSQSFRCTNEVCNIAKRVALNEVAPNNTFHGFDREANIVSTFYISRTNVGGLSRIIELIKNEEIFTTSIDLHALRKEIFDFTSIASISAISQKTTFTKKWLGDNKSTEFLSDDGVKDVIEYEKSSKSDTILVFMEHRYGSYDSLRAVLKTLENAGMSLKGVIEKVAEIKKNNKVFNIHVTTAHKSKGSTCDAVIMEEDFKPLEELRAVMIEGLCDLFGKDIDLTGGFREVYERYENLQPVLDYKAELFTLYVAITRARFEVNLPSWAYC